MNKQSHTPLFGCIAVIFICTCGLHAEKVMVYDEVRGIVFMEKDSLKNRQAKPAASLTAGAPTVMTTSETTVVSTTVRRGSKDDLHLNRRKDPPELYFKSALEYFRGADWENALRNFRYADSLAPKPAYRLWIGKTYRQMGRTDQMLQTMEQLMRTDPQSDVADDALFEIAFFHQVNGSYDSAAQYYARLAEQYPFGTSYSNGEPFLDVSREQRKAMRMELADKLEALGYASDDLADRLRRFQKARKLEVTATAGAATVRAVKTEYDRLVQNLGSNGAAVAIKARRQLKHAAAIGAFFLVMSIFLLAIFARIKARSRQLDAQRQVLAELTTSQPRAGGAP